MSKTNTAAGQQAAAFETSRKMELVIEWLQVQAIQRLKAGAHGRLIIELVFEAGAITRAKLNDETTILNLTDKERELVLRAEAGKNSG